MKNIEIEVKLKIENVKPLEELIEKEGEFIKEKHQIDVYYSPQHRDFLKVRPVDEWLRLRNSDGVASINYKNWHSNEEGIANHCTEFESGISDFETLQSILEVLDFKKLITVDKLRRVWMYKDYEISLDTVKDLGSFVELEYKGESDDVDPKEIVEEMIGFVRSLGCGKVERDKVGYPYLLLFGNG